MVHGDRPKLPVVFKLLLGGVFVVVLYMIFVLGSGHLYLSIPLFKTSDYPRFNTHSQIFLDTEQYKSELYPMIVNQRASPIDIVIHSVHFDYRSRDGHDNATVFILAVHSNILQYNLISGCGTDSHTADSYKVGLGANFSVRIIQQPKLWHV